MKNANTVREGSALARLTRTLILFGMAFGIVFGVVDWARAGETVAIVETAR